MKRLNFGLGGLLLLLTTGCMPQFLQNKQAELCTRLNTVEASIQQFRAIEKDPNLTTLKQAETQIRDAFQQVKSTAETAPTAETETSIAPVEAASKDLATSVQQAPGQTTNQSQVAQATAQISQRVTRLETAVKNMKTRIQCPAIAPSPSPSPSP